MVPRPLLAAGALALLIGGCRPAAQPPAPSLPSTGLDAAAAANGAFLRRPSYDPWLLSASSGDPYGPVYVADGKDGYLIDTDGKPIQRISAGTYDANGNLAPQPLASDAGSAAGGPGAMTLDLHSGALTIERGGRPQPAAPAGFHGRDWKSLWDRTDIVIDGDPEAQQVTHANLFYLLSSVDPAGAHSVPPMGLSSTLYNGHIFWDADSWMLPALIVQHPADARAIVDYRFRTLRQAIKNAKAKGLPGAEYPWESAATGAEQAPAEFARERHITADVAFGAWQYYLWTGDRAYLEKEGWPILRATAQYWAAFVRKGPDGRYHVNQVLPPDETAGVVDDDLYTNAAVRYNLRAAARAARIVGQPADPAWTSIADTIADPPRLAASGSDAPASPIPAPHAGKGGPSMAKQADALLVLHPLGDRYPAAVAGAMLDYYSSHTIKNGPAMTAGIHAVIAARLGRAQQSLDFYRESYRPFERGSWDAFSEKRTASRTYFCTGMAANLEAVLYGFAGLNVATAATPGIGKRIVGDGVVALYADPHLPPGWTSLTLKGVAFRGKVVDIAIEGSNRVVVTAR